MPEVFNTWRAGGIKNKKALTTVTTVRMLMQAMPAAEENAVHDQLKTGLPIIAAHRREQKSERAMTRPWKIPSFYLTGLPLPYCLPPEKQKKDKAKSHLDFNGDSGPFGESEADQLIIASRIVFIYAESESSA